MQKSHKAILLLEIIVLLAVGAVLLYKEFNSVVKDSVTVEAGQAVQASEFLTGNDKEAVFVTDISAISLNNPGYYDIEIKVDGKIYGSTIRVVDTIPPQADARSVISPKGKVLEADEFVTNIIDASEVRVEFKELPDFTRPGEHAVTVVLEDSGNNRTELDSVLFILNIKQSVRVEAGVALDIAPKDFLLDDLYDASFESDISELDITAPGIHEVELRVGDKRVTVAVEVVDTTPPSCSVIDREIWLGDSVKAGDFVVDITDFSEVVVYYKEDPDFNRLGQQEVAVILEDSSGNKTEKKALLFIRQDNEPPVITGAVDRIVYIGQTVSYRTNVSVTDNSSSEVQLEIDSSEVNLRREGVYSVTYKATDKSGNTSERTIKVTVIEQTVTEEAVLELADEILSEIITDGMTKRDKAYAIYKWIRNNMIYKSDTLPTDWLKEAYLGITGGGGDCFTFYSVAEVLLTRAGIDNIKVTRVGGRTNHYWNLINCGDGWYHFDSCRYIDFKDTFMMTDAELEQLSKERGRGYYDFDKALYPRTPD